MEGGNGLSNLKNFVYTPQNTLVSPFPLIANPTSCPNSLPTEPNPNLKSSDGVPYHQRCSSESFLLEEQPSWLDDLLDESDSSFFNRGHRRSASDSYAYLCEATETFAIRDQETKNLFQFKHGEKASMESKKIDEESEEVGSTIAVEQRREENSSKSPEEESADRAGGSQVKTSSSKTEAKRAKQHNAHRSRVRKLQYIAHLERTVQNLQTEGSEISAELEFVEQQNIILVMENRALRQRLETISQEQLIKHWELEMLEREIARLQNVYHLQKQQQQQQEQESQHHQHPKQRLNKSRDHMDQTTNGFQMNNKEASSSKGSANGSVRI